MMSDRDLESALASWLREPATVTDDFHEVLARLPSTPQRRRLSSRLGIWGWQDMLSATRILVATVIVALFGTFLIGGQSLMRPEDRAAVGPAASASPEPAASSAVTPSPSPTTKSDRPRRVNTAVPGLELVFGSVSGPGWTGDDASVGWRDPGTWTITDVRTDNDEMLRFHVSVTPPAPGSPLEAGPAVIGAGVSFIGSRYRELRYARDVETVFAKAGDCSGEPCTYEADVALDLGRVQRAMDARPDVRPTSVEVNLSLIRTYGQGEWIQVLSLLIPEQGGVPSPVHGTLRRPKAAEGAIAAGGIRRAADVRAAREGRRRARELADMVEASRVRQGDASAVLPTVEVETHVELVGCEPWEPIWMVDDWGAVALDRHAGEVDPGGETISVPDRGSWRLAMGDPFPELSDDTATAMAGWFETAGSDLRVSATFDCTIPNHPRATAFEVTDAAGGHPLESASAGELSETVRDDIFALSITTDKRTWTVGEPIDVRATLAYVGEADEMTVTGYGSGLVGFGIQQLDGPVDQGPGWRSSQRPYPVSSGYSVEAPFTKSGGYDADGPMASFWRGWFKDPRLRPPAGTYRIIALAHYRAPGPRGEPVERELEAAVTIEVVDEGPTESRHPAGGS